MPPAASIAICLFCIGTAVSPAALAGEMNFEIPGLQGTAWLPATGRKKAPVIIFSHGFHGCPTQSRFLMNALAEAGYAVLAPRHADATCGNLMKWFDGAEQPFGDADKWDDTTYAARMHDVRQLLDASPRDPAFAGLDWRHVGIAGHSLGGYTAMGIGGAWPSWKDSRVQAVLALSPYSAPFVLRHTLGSISVPVMYQGGTLDTGITPFINKGGSAYDGTPAPKYYVELSGAGHFAWTNIDPFYRSTIDAYAVAFFDTYLRGKSFPESLSHRLKDVFDLRIQVRPRSESANFRKKQTGSPV